MLDEIPLGTRVKAILAIHRPTLETVEGTLTDYYDDGICIVRDDYGNNHTCLVKGIETAVIASAVN
ncbi:MAG: hypothetical protein HYW86_02370 [Candidatus Roizmanbacteria bacterium]|nr:MAG: hypothetical protein HYW86_02370 [Candidatus Roizmanbacteria bacterium]